MMNQAISALDGANDFRPSVGSWLLTQRLRKAQDVGCSMRKDALLVRTPPVTDRAVLLIHVVQGYPYCQSLVRLQAEVVPVLMGWCCCSDTRWFIKELE